MTLTEDRPIFQQIAEQLEEAILSGAYPEESQVPSITEYSVQYRINPATALKGINLLVDAGLLYKNGLDVTLAYEHEMNYRHAWEFFANGYLQWAECESCKHVCPKSFWRNYRTYSFGVAYKPCVTRGRNHYGSLRIGASGGSDTKKFLAGLHFGYEHNYVSVSYTHLTLPTNSRV